MPAKLPLNLGPRYRAVSEIASGGMGAVYLALRLAADGSRRPVAIKYLHAHLADDPEIVAHFVDEARIASRIIHPNVVRVEDVEMIGERLVIVMEYVDGVPLSVVLKAVRARETLLPLPVVRRILHDALLGLHAAHELRDANGSAGVVHRDVSPHNLLLTADGTTRVTDFGIATASGRVASTRTGDSVKGKLQYLSPEQIYRRPVDRRTDVFASGTILWECLTGRRLFSAGTEGETLAMILREPIAPPSTHRHEIPLELDEICLRALERDPERRFATAEELACALDDGRMAPHAEVAALTAAAASTTLAARRSILEDALRRPEPPRSEPFAVDTAASVAVARNAERAMPSRARAPLVAVLVIGLFAGGVGVGLAVRRSPPAAATANVVPPAQAESPMVPLSSTVVPVVPSAPASVLATPSASAKARPAPAPSTRAGKKAPAPPAKPFMPSDL